MRKILTKNKQTVGTPKPTHTQIEKQLVVESNKRLESFIVDLRSDSEEDDSNDYIDIDDIQY